MANTFFHGDYQTTHIIRSGQLNALPRKKQRLALHLSDTALKVCCVDAHNEKCLYLAAHHFPNDSVGKRIAVLEKLYQEDAVLKTRDWLSVTLCIDNQQYTLLPGILLQTTHLDTYLAFVCPQGSGVARHFNHSLLPVTVVFGMDKLLYNWFQQMYEPTPLQCFHQASSLIEGSFHYVSYHRSTTSNRIFAFIDSGCLHIVVFRRYELLYYNRFKCVSTDDYLQYILMVMQALALDPKTDDVILAGDVQRDALIYKEIKKYVRKVELYGKSSSINWSRDLKSGTSTNYFDVLSSFLCHPAQGKSG